MGDLRHGLFDSCLREHFGRGDLTGILKLSIAPRQTWEPARYLWRVDATSIDYGWLNEALSQLRNKRRGEFEAFLRQCFEAAARNPDRPFRAMFI